MIITAGASGQEGKDRPDLYFDAPDEQMLRETLQAAKEAGKKTILLMNVAGPVELGEYELLLGNSSRNITASVMVTLTGKNPYGCSLSSAIAKIAADKEACGICVEVLGDLFDFDSFMSSVTYFGDAKLEDYLNQYIRGIDKKSEKWEKMLQIIRARLADL